MIEPRFNLRDTTAKGATAINLVLNYENLRVKISTGKSVPPKYWNPKNDRVKENREFIDYAKINRDLDKMEDTFKDAFEFFQSQDIIPNPETLKAKYYELIENPQKLNSKSTFWKHFDEFVEYQKGRISPRTLIDYDNALRKHILETEKNYKVHPSFNSLKRSGNFVEKLELYLNNHAINSEGSTGMSLNAKGKQMKNIKSFLNWCFMKDYCQPFNLKHIITHSEEVDNVYLTKEEQDAIYFRIFEEKEFEEVRDLFIVGCETALRYSDFVRIKQEHINNDTLSMYQKKTKSKVVIPISKRLREILEKYNYHLPQRSDNEMTTFNELLRNICESCSINDSIVIQQTRGLRSEEKYYKKFELISSHTARRSYCTVKFLKGVPPKAIMAVSGHKTEKAFMKYLKLNQQEIVMSYREMLIAV